MPVRVNGYQSGPGHVLGWLNVISKFKALSRLLTPTQTTSAPSHIQIIVYIENHLVNYMRQAVIT